MHTHTHIHIHTHKHSHALTHTHAHAHIHTHPPHIVSAAMFDNRALNFAIKRTYVLR